MGERLRDLQHRIQADGRNYIIEVCAPGKNPAPVSAGPFDVHVTIAIDEIFPEWTHTEPEQFVRHVVESVKPLVPASVTSDQWSSFADFVLVWVYAHRDAAA